MRSETEILQDLKENDCPEDGMPCTNMVFGCGDCSKPGDLESMRIEREIEDSYVNDVWMKVDRAVMG